MFGGLGMPELIIILVIILIIFGAGKLPQIGEGMGKAIRNFKSATSDKESKEPPKIDQDNKE
jgi:sec-independent protein translocase protein TatA